MIGLHTQQAIHKGFLVFLLTHFPFYFKVINMGESREKGGKDSTITGKRHYDEKFVDFESPRTGSNYVSNEKRNVITTRGKRRRGGGINIRIEGTERKRRCENKRGCEKGEKNKNRFEKK